MNEYTLDLLPKVSLEPNRMRLYTSLDRIKALLSQDTAVRPEARWKPVHEITKPIETARRHGYVTEASDEVGLFEKATGEPIYIANRLTYLKNQILQRVNKLANDSVTLTLTVPAGLPDGDLNSLIARYETLLALQESGGSKEKIEQMKRIFGEVKDKIKRKHRELMLGSMSRDFRFRFGKQDLKREPFTYKDFLVLNDIFALNKELMRQSMGSSIIIFSADGTFFEVFYPHLNMKGGVTEVTAMYFDEETYKSIGDLLKAQAVQSDPNNVVPVFKKMGGALGESKKQMYEMAIADALTGLITKEKATGKALTQEGELEIQQSLEKPRSILDERLYEKIKNLYHSFYYTLVYGDLAYMDGGRVDPLPNLDKVYFDAAFDLLHGRSTLASLELENSFLKTNEAKGKIASRMSVLLRIERNLPPEFPQSFV